MYLRCPCDVPVVPSSPRWVWRCRCCCWGHVPGLPHGAPGLQPVPRGLLGRALGAPRAPLFSPRGVAVRPPRSAGCRAQPRVRALERHLHGQRSTPPHYCHNYCAVLHCACTVLYYCDTSETVRSTVLYAFQHRTALRRSLCSGLGCGRGMDEWFSLSSCVLLARWRPWSREWPSPTRSSPNLLALASALSPVPASLRLALSHESVACPLPPAPCPLL